MADRWAWNAVCAIGPAEGEQIVQATRRLDCDANGVEGDYGRDGGEFLLAPSWASSALRGS